LRRSGAPTKTLSLRRKMGGGPDLFNPVTI
jgi:hypothetical protein